MPNSSIVSRPPLLDGANYEYWKAQLMAFLKSLDLNCWKAVMAGWEQPTETSEDVGLHVFKLVNTCMSAKEAWDILEVAYKGTSKVKTSRLQILTSQFEEMKMEEDQSLSEYNVKILDIANKSFLLGERIPESKLVRKVLSSLPQRFNMKVTTIEEANDITKMKLEEQFGSLKTFELTLGDRDSRRMNEVVFSTVDEENT
ncbi:gag-pol polyprotein [Cucumis melo var. makuwa]|uniref:Gag-pol polyprotein n=1 Tax=Cucumis melo var. makuwa TaxID=1194695 RepID=A0A5D3DAN5_CUCMM|nr:gag-pol polyprotein [Cucumis melo var. makuwa]TYK20574.1 gag-pol polyprotein [Cucumis melo var. makuwa]